MVADAEPLEMREDIYDIEYLEKQRKQLIKMERLLRVGTIVIAAPTLFAILFRLKLPIPFYYTHGVFGYLLSSVAIVLYMVELVCAVLAWWKTTHDF